MAGNYWFSAAVTSAMLVDKRKSVSLCWELNSSFMEIVLVLFIDMASLSNESSTERTDFSFFAQDRKNRIVVMVVVVQKKKKCGGAGG